VRVTDAWDNCIHTTTWVATTLRFRVVCCFE